MFLHVRRKQRYLQAYAFQKFRLEVQKLKFYALVTMKNKLSAKLLLSNRSENYSPIKNEEVLKAQNTIPIIAKEKSRACKKILIFRKNKERMKMLSFLSKWRNLVCKNGGEKYKNALIKILDEINQIKSREELNEKRMKNISQDLDSLLNSQ